MKKILALLLSLSISCIFFAACTDEDTGSYENDKDVFSASLPADDSSNGNDGASETDNIGTESGNSNAKDDESSLSGHSNSNTEGGKLTKLMAEVIEKRSCTYVMESDDDRRYGTTDFENVYLEYNVLGIDIVSLVTADGSNYVIDNDGMRYYPDETESFGVNSDDLLEEFYEMSRLKLLSTTVETINGEKYVVEVYDSYGEKLSFAFNSSDELCYFRDDMGEYAPYALSVTADTSKFSLDGYTEMTFEEYDEWMQQLLNGYVE